ncbi:MAG: hypothetical protein M1840_005451 [Geoglossum simile]|nr:MAG: hypothetical protein M1840_005451 [Geoglossum simile]
MEDIHGVDVSWLHHSQKDNNTRSPAAAGSKKPEDLTYEEVPEAPPSSSNGPTARASPPNGLQTPQQHTISRSTPDERPTPTGPTQSSQLRVPTPPSTPTGRRGSWLSSLSSKFSSSSSPPPLPSAAPSAASKPQSGKAPTITQNATHIPPVPEDTSRTHPPQNVSKPSHPSFFQSALRRLSSSSTQLSGNVSKLHANGGRVERRVMNVDRNRERCRIQELDTGKLRRVSFCVDVEIAGIPRYMEEEDAVKKGECQKGKEKRPKGRGEGEALKHPDRVDRVDEGVEGRVEGANEQAGQKDPEPKVLKTEEGIGTKPGEKKASSKRKEKRKRSEEERKERKERRRKQAEANGTVPIELSIETSKQPAGDASNPSTPSSSTPRPQDKPTTDPLRIYRRCCQLRETPTVKKILEQLSSPVYSETGVVSRLDLSGHWFQLVDVVTFGDFLALVPIKKLLLGNCGLGDEAVRIILAGLLAVKGPTEELSPEAPQLVINGIENVGIEKLHDGSPKRDEFRETHGVVEKLSLKNNPSIGRDGWRHIGLFIHMSRSIKAIDLSMIPFPQEIPISSSPGSIRQATGGPTPIEIASVFSQAIAERFGGAQLEEIVMAECDLNGSQIGKIVDGVIKSGASRLGLASNHINEEGLEHVVRYIREGRCEGLDLGGNDLGSLMSTLAGALNDKCPLYALSLAECCLTPSSLSRLFPALVSLPNFRFIDLSHNRALFQTQPDALSLARKYLPQLHMLKRIHLMDVALTPEHAIALAEILPEIPNLAHLNILENPQLSALASTGSEASQEEASALYASLMTAVKVSNTIVCIDIDVPGENSSEVVKALAKQVVAYCLRNMEHGPIAEFGSTTAATTDPHGGEKEVAIPGVLLHLVGHAEDDSEEQDDQSVRDDDYIVGGTGIIKALGVCLGNMSHDTRQSPSENLASTGGVATPKAALSELGYGRGKAKDMSKALLEYARKIRSRLQPALAREAKMDDQMNHRRLSFLDQTLARMIQRFEDEYPECRLGNGASHLPPHPEPVLGIAPCSWNDWSSTGREDAEGEALTEEDKEDKTLLARHNPDVSLAYRALSNEEGRMHRFGQRMRREVLSSQGLDHEPEITDEEEESEKIKALRSRMEAMKGEEIKERVETMGAEAIIRELSTDAEGLRAIQRQDPEAFAQFRAAQLIAEHNLATISPHYPKVAGGSPEEQPSTKTDIGVEAKCP